MVAGARGFAAASSKAADAGQQQEKQSGGIEGYVFKGLLFATILAIGLKLGPHIGVPQSFQSNGSALSGNTRHC